MYDIVIIGAGPAGMTAAIYAKQARKNVLVIEKKTYGGQILKADKIKNYPGYIEISGFEFATKLYDQMKKYNAEFTIENVIEIKNENEYKLIITDKNIYKSKTIIIATGAKNRKLGLKMEDKLIGKGISYCATCDGIFFKNKIVAIYGGGNNAIDDALYLSNIAQKVYLIYRQKEFKIDSDNLEKLKKKNNVEFILNSLITDINGSSTLKNIIVTNSETNENKPIDVDGLFIAIGHIPVTNMLNGLISLNEKGYIVSCEDCTTNIDGIFVAGDIKEKSIRQLTTACSDGTIAALNACKYINQKKAIK